MMESEVFRLTLTHYMEDVNQKDGRFLLEEPLVVQMIVDRTYGPRPIVLNEMLDMMKEAVLKNTDDNSTYTFRM